MHVVSLQKVIELARIFEPEETPHLRPCEMAVSVFLHGQCLENQPR